MDFTVRSGSGERAADIGIEVALLAGYTGRDQAAVRAHIAELSEHGIPAPAEVPAVYPVPGTRVLATDAIYVCGPKTTGEAEFVLLHSGDELLIGLGSDHTDRELEEHSVLKAKQTCDKPVCPVLWPFAELADHWDQLVLRAHIRTSAGWELYQDGSVASMLTPERILDTVHNRGVTHASAAVFSGTVPMIGGEFRFGTAFRATLSDPVLDRSLVCEYAVRELPELDT